MRAGAPPRSASATALLALRRRAREDPRATREDLSHELPDAPLRGAAATGAKPLPVVGAIVGADADGRERTERRHVRGVADAASKITGDARPLLRSVVRLRLLEMARLAVERTAAAMSRHWDDVPEAVRATFTRGSVIPAHPLALDARRRLDERRQRALTRYYLDAGAGGLAVGVHATQFAIRDVGLYEPVLGLAAREAAEWTSRPVVLIAGLAGRTAEAVREAEIAVGLGYHAGLLSLGALGGASEDELVAHCAAVARTIPLVGFYLQLAVGGIALSRRFWQRFAAIENVVGVKIAPFNRYKTLDVVRGVAASHAEDRVTLYTGNDDHIIPDLLTPFVVPRDGEQVTVRIRGGLLGHWSVWTRGAVALLNEIHAAIERPGRGGGEALLGLDARVTDCNAAFFDVANGFRGCIPGCHEVLRRQGLLEGIWCLDPDETLSPGQSAEIDRVTREHADLADDAFVARHRERWLS